MPKVLIVEDDDLIRERLVKALTFEGYQVVDAENGRVGLELLDRDKPDLVICDILMPELGGFDFVSILRSRPETRTVPIIMLTALSERLSQREFMELGADDYLTKPFHIEELVRAVKTQLRKMKWWEDERQDVNEAQYLGFASWRLDVERRSLTSASGVERHLTISEVNNLFSVG